MNIPTKHVPLIIALLLGAAVPLAIARPPGRDCTAGSACAPAAESKAPLALGEAARTALLFQIEEERMARELYTAFGEKWDLRPFQHIPRSESRHEEALRALAERAGITVPAAVPGKFNSAEVQRRHDTLLALGSKSAEDALRAGAGVEEQDIADLRALVAATDSVELRQTAAALEQASGHHLSAFVRNLSARGIDYAPQILAGTDVSGLTAGQNGCGQDCGRGRRRGRG